jgi:hypothetical protein
MMCPHSFFGSCSCFLELRQARVTRPLLPMKQLLMLPALKQPRLFTPSSHPPYQHTVLKAWLLPPSHLQSLYSPLHPRPYQQPEYQLQVVDLSSRHRHHCMLLFSHSLRKN